MARLSDLTRVLSTSFDIALPSLTVIARVLREAGLIATGMRGPGAQMRPEDLSHVLIALAADGPHLKSAQTVNQVGSLKLHAAKSTNSSLRNVEWFVTERFKIDSSISFASFMSIIISRYDCKFFHEIDFSDEYIHQDLDQFFNDERVPCVLSMTVTRYREEWRSIVNIIDKHNRRYEFVFCNKPEHKYFSAQDGREISVTLKSGGIHSAICCLNNIGTMPPATSVGRVQ